MKVMTADELKAALAARGIPDAQVREFYNMDLLTVAVEREHNGRRWSFASRTVPLNPSSEYLDGLADEIKQLWIEDTEGA